MKKHTNESKNAIYKQVMEEVKRQLPNMIQEISSTMATDAAEKADRFGNKRMADRFREYAENRRKEELAQSYDDVFEVLGEYSPFVGKSEQKLYILRYIPTNIVCLAQIKNKKDAAVLRVRGNELVEITQPEIINDFAGLLKHNVVKKGSLRSFGSSFGGTRQMATRVVKFVNDTLGTNISWRYFCADSNSIEKTENVKVDKVIPLNAAKINYIKVGLSRYATEQKPYTIYYVIISDEKLGATLGFRIYEFKKCNVVSSNKQSGPVLEALKRTYKKTFENAPAPNRETCKIEYLHQYVFAKSKKKYVAALFNFIAGELNIRIDFQNFQDAYDAELANINLAEIGLQVSAQIEDEGGAALDPTQSLMDYADF